MKAVTKHVNSPERSSKLRGLRTKFVNDRGEVTELDQETAEALFMDAANIPRVWDSGKQGWVETHKVYWLDETPGAVKHYLNTPYVPED